MPTSATGDHAVPIVSAQLRYAMPLTTGKNSSDLARICVNQHFDMQMQNVDLESKVHECVTNIANFQCFARFTMKMI